MGRWLSGIVAAVISGLAVIALAAWLWPEPDPDPGNGPSTTDPAAPPIEAEGSRVAVLPGVHISPEQAGSLRWVEMAIDLDTGARDDGPGGDVGVAIDFDEEVAWLRADEAVEADPSPSYQDCVSALAGAGEYVQPFEGRPTICVRTDEGRVAWFRMGEVTLFPEPDAEMYTIEGSYEFRTWSLGS